MLLPTVPPAPIQSILYFDLLPRKQVFAQFDTPRASSDGAPPCSIACDKLLGLTAALVACLGDTRLDFRAKHSFTDMLRQRADPALKMLLGRRPRLPVHSAPL